MQKRREICYNSCKSCAQALTGALPRRNLDAGRAKLDALCAALQAGSRARWQEKSRQFAHAVALTDSLDPYQVLARGYAMVAGRDGKIRQADCLAAGEEICLVTARRRARCLVTAVEENHESTQDV